MITGIYDSALQKSPPGYASEYLAALVLLLQAHSLNTFFVL